MKRFRLLALTALLISIQLVSLGCHGNIFAQDFIVYVNEKDQNQVVEFPVAGQSWRSWWQGLPKEAYPEGQYIRGDGKEQMSGSYWSEADAYVLKGDGVNKESRFSIQPDLSLRDENGDIWRRGSMVRHEVAMNLKAWPGQN